VLDAGVNLQRIHAHLGYCSHITTSVYTYLTARAEPLGAEAINRIMQEL
jgi:hypothetical protein